MDAFKAASLTAVNVISENKILNMMTSQFWNMSPRKWIKIKFDSSHKNWLLWSVPLSVYSPPGWLGVVPIAVVWPGVLVCIYDLVVHVASVLGYRLGVLLFDHVCHLQHRIYSGGLVSDGYRYPSDMSMLHYIWQGAQVLLASIICKQDWKLFIQVVRLSACQPDQRRCWCCQIQNLQNL